MTKAMKAKVNPVLEKMKEILESTLGTDRENVTMNANLVDDLGADSLDVVEIVMAVEEKFGLENEIPDEIADNVKTVGELVKYVEKVQKK